MENKKLLELLVRSLDSSISNEEQVLLNDALEKNSWLQNEQKELLTIRQHLGDFEIQQNISFAENVIRALQVKPLNQFSSQITNWFPRIAMVFAVLFFLVIANIYYSEGQIDSDTIIGLQDLSPEDAYAVIEMNEDPDLSE